MSICTSLTQRQYYRRLYISPTPTIGIISLCLFPINSQAQDKKYFVLTFNTPGTHWKLIEDGIVGSVVITSQLNQRSFHKTDKTLSNCQNPSLRAWATFWHSNWKWLNIKIHDRSILLNHLQVLCWQHYWNNYFLLQLYMNKEAIWPWTNRVFYLSILLAKFYFEDLCRLHKSNLRLSHINSMGILYIFWIIRVPWVLKLLSFVSLVFCHAPGIKESTRFRRKLGENVCYFWFKEVMWPLWLSDRFSTGLKWKPKSSPFQRYQAPYYRILTISLPWA